jgi:hypothetical protein
MKQHTVRAKDGGVVTLHLSPAMAIKVNCMECLGWECNPKTDCTSPLCACFPFRGYTRRAYVSGAFSPKPRKSVISAAKQPRGTVEPCEDGG